MMAGCAFFDIRVHGKGGHGARPENTVDPVVCGAQIVSALQTVVARNVPRRRRRWSASPASTRAGLQRHPGARGAARHGARVPRRNDALGRGADARAGREHRRRLRRPAALDFREVTIPVVNAAEQTRSSPTPPLRWWARTASSGTGRR
jgi:acetylornithine deacetylase/succinyl-diaminopimelate desuccinylase-like protein